ncbi:DDE-type integrase/transposase/recombinase [Candidatus Palauibacter sp.]|uniref:DDE-type integrase/transposase/recombinase n=1 Tax=Candidatus Palauibacter sp. TaxID=3101350 RepID=UPI003B013776
MWCADITYVPVTQGFFYLVAGMDWATRHVLAWRLSNTMDASFRVEALDDALGWRAPEILNPDSLLSGRGPYWNPSFPAGGGPPGGGSTPGERTGTAPEGSHNRSESTLTLPSDCPTNWDRLRPMSPPLRPSTSRDGPTVVCRAPPAPHATDLGWHWDHLVVDATMLVHRIDE